MPVSIYKIMTSKDWRDFQLTSVYAGSAVDLADGYIHFSTAEQLEETLIKHYAGQGDLVVLEVDAVSLDQAQLKWEPASGGPLIPHLYEPLRLDAVCQAVSVPLLEDGRFGLPADMLSHG